MKSFIYLLREVLECNFYLFSRQQCNLREIMVKILTTENSISQREPSVLAVLASANVLVICSHHEEVGHRQLIGCLTKLGPIVQMGYFNPSWWLVPPVNSHLWSKVLMIIYLSNRSHYLFVLKAFLKRKLHCIMLDTMVNSLTCKLHLINIFNILYFLCSCALKKRSKHS